MSQINAIRKERVNFLQTEQRLIQQIKDSQEKEKQTLSNVQKIISQTNLS